MTEITLCLTKTLLKTQLGNLKLKRAIGHCKKTHHHHSLNFVYLLFNNTGRPIVPACSCLTELIWHHSSRLYHHTLRTANMLLTLFATLIILTKTNFFSLWILHLLIMSFPMTKVSRPSNIFSINALLRNLALKQNSV